MCQFFSAIVTKDSILYDKNIDQHEILIKNYNLDDTTLTPEFVRVELTPPNNNVFEKDLTKWNFNTDQDLIPTWYNETVAKEKTINVLSNIYSEIIFENVKDIVIKEGRVFLENSSAKLYGSSSAKLFYNSSAILFHNSSAQLWDTSSAQLWDSSSAELFHKSSAILCDNSSAKLYGSSSAKLFHSSSAILYDNSSAKLFHSSSAKLYNTSSAQLWDRAICDKHSKDVKILGIEDNAIVREGDKIYVKNGSSYELIKL